MWTVIIIIAVCFIGKFVLDSINQSNDMKAQGGVRTKYAHQDECPERGDC